MAKMSIPAIRSQPQAPQKPGQGFLIDPSAFTDNRRMAERGQSNKPIPLKSNTNSMF